MKKILVPTDFSDIANNALAEALNIAKKSGAEIILLNVIEEGSSGSVRVTGEALSGNPQENIFMIKLIEKTKGQMEDLINNNSDVQITSELRLGNPYHGITDIISDHDVDMVVMGTEGASGIQELITGSNAEKVVRHAKCPVLSVHDRSNGKYENLVFATSMDDNEDGLVNMLKQIQSLYDSQIHLVWVNTPNNFERDKLTNERMRRFVKKHDLQNCTINIYNDITEEDGIISFAEDKNADAIAMITHGRTGFAHLVAGSIAEDVVNHTKRPVLTFGVDK